MQILGAKGSGKSTVVCTVAAYLLVSGQRRVVYILGKQFVVDPVTVLVDALLLAFGKSKDQELAKLEDVEIVITWCRGKERGSLLFVVDDWDIFEKSGSDLQGKLQRAAMFQVLVTVSSFNRRQRQLWQTNDKADEEMETFHFDGPYNSSELATWLGQSGLDASKLDSVERLTGGMPRMLRFFEEVQGNEEEFVEKIDGVYTQKLFKKFIGNLVTPGELSAGVTLLVSGVCGLELTSDKVDMTCFYYVQEEGRFQTLSPFLRDQAERHIMDQHENLRSSLHYSHIEKWAAAVRMYCERDQGPRNSARLGWNVEGLVISVVLYQKQLFGYSFKHYKEYRHGCERDALAELTTGDLLEGILLAPAALNEKAVDLILIKLESNGTLRIVAVQITVAPWKIKSKKRSHEAWKEEVLPNWILEGNRAYVDEYHFVMPESVKPAADVPASFERFADINKCLKVFDVLLKLAKAATLAKPKLKRCNGQTLSGLPCKKQARCDTPQYYCVFHQQPAAE